MKKNQIMETRAASNKFVGFIKAHKKLIVLFAIIIVAIIAVLITCVIVPTVKAAQAKSYLNGRMFITTGDEPYIYKFTGDKVAQEHWLDEGRTYGSLTEFKKYRVSASITEDRITVEVEDGNDWVKLRDIARVNGSWLSKIITQEEYDKRRAMHTCEHTFGESDIIKEATCTSQGEEKRICEKCGYEETIKTDRLPHTYEDGVCTVCGYKKPAESSKPSDSTSSGSSSGLDRTYVDWLDPDVWYTFNELDSLHMQNCVVMEANFTGGGKHVTALYSPVCKHCHYNGSLCMVGAEWDYEVREPYHCPDCGTTTICRFILK